MAIFELVSISYIVLLSKARDKILVIIPTYNESENIVGLLNEIHATYPEIDICVVNDASTDGSGQLAESTGHAIVINLPINLGIGGSVQTGFKYARENNYEIVLQLDGDGQHKVSEIEKLIKPILDQQADVVIGSRFNRKSKGFTTQAPRHGERRSIVPNTKVRVVDLDTGKRGTRVAVHPPGNKNCAIRQKRGRVAGPATV